MSYCRFSCDNWKSDVYCYASVYGCWTTHVAAQRIVGPVPELPDYNTDPEAWALAHKEQTNFVGSAERQPIGLPHDGETFEDPTIEAFRDRLVLLKSAGYHVPEFVFEAIQEEMESSIADT